MRDCKQCKYSEIVQVGRMDFDVPLCQLDNTEWLKCRSNDYNRFEEREDKTNE